MDEVSVRDLKDTCLLKVLLTGDVKATSNQTALDIGIQTVDNFSKALVVMTRNTFLVYASRKQKRYLCRHLI